MFQVNPPPTQYPADCVRKRFGMANTMQGFFDQRHFDQDCICHTGENQVNDECMAHSKPSSAAYQPIDYADETEVMPVEINQSFPRQPTSENLSSLIEYRIKILAASNLKFQPGEGGKIKTNTMITRKAGKLSMLMKPAENLPLRFLSEGLISPLFRGPLTVELQNSSGENVHLRAGSLIAYMVLTPFIE